MADHVHRSPRRQQRLQQAQLVGDGEVMTVEPGIGPAVTNEIWGDDAKARLHASMMDVHITDALAEPCSRSTGVPVPAARIELRRMGRAGMPAWLQSC